MTNQIERIQIRIDLFGKRFQPKAFFLKLIDDGLLPVSLRSTA